MAIEFDVTKISLPEENTYIKNEKGEDILNGLTEVMIILTMFIGIKDITEKNYKDFHKRVKEFEVASGMKNQMSIFGNDYNTEDGTCVRDYIHVNDLAAAHLKAIEKIKDNSSIITNVATGNFHSVLDVINKAEMITNKKIHYIIDERREGDPDKLYASSNNILNHQNQYSDLETIIKSMWKVYRN